MAGHKPSRQRTAPLSVRFDDAELEALRVRAGRLPLSTYVRQAALSGEGYGVQRRRTRVAPLQDAEPLARALAVLGQSEIAGSLSDLARQANDGTLFVDEGVTARLTQAYDILLEMRFLLLQALGKSIVDAVAEPASGEVSSRFRAAVMADQS